jgi:hypothetical protein
MLALGIPAKPVRELAEKDFTLIHRTREHYRNLMAAYMKMLD